MVKIQYRANIAISSSFERKMVNFTR